MTDQKAPQNRYVRNMTTGVIFPFTALLARRKNFETLSIALCAEYERRLEAGQAAVNEMQDRLLQADVSGEAVSSTELAGELGAQSEEALAALREKSTVTTSEAAAVSVEAIKVPEDFDLGVDISTMNKPQVQAVADKLGYPLAATKVGEMKSELQAVLEQLRARAAA